MCEIKYSTRRDPAPSREADALVELWLRRTLATRFDAMLTEPLPAQWLRILDRAPALE